MGTFLMRGRSSWRIQALLSGTTLILVGVASRRACLVPHVAGRCGDAILLEDGGRRTSLLAAEKL